MSVWTLPSPTLWLIWVSVCKILFKLSFFYLSSLRQKRRPAVAQRQPALFFSSSSSCLFVSDHTGRIFMSFINVVSIHIFDPLMDFSQVFGSRSFCWPQSHPTTFWWSICHWQRSCQFTLTHHNRAATSTWHPHLWVWNPLWLLIHFTYCNSQYDFQLKEKQQGDYLKNNRSCCCRFAKLSSEVCQPDTCGPSFLKNFIKKMSYLCS